MDVTELQQVVADMELWADRGTTATGEAKVLGSLIKAHLAAEAPSEEDDSIYFMSDETMARLIETMFNGPTEGIRGAAKRVLDLYANHLAFRQPPTLRDTELERNA